MKKKWLILPTQFLERLEKIYGKKEAENIFASFGEVKPTTFRANTLKITAEELAKRLTANNIQFQKVSWWENAFILEDKTLRNLTESDFYREGYIYVQSLSSMIPPLVLDPERNERILDIAAAPGSKTTQIAALMHNTGEITANDNSRIRLYKLEANLKLQGITNTKVTLGAGQTIWQKYPEYFDKVLVDVPCSMEGRFLSRDPRTFSFWSVRKIKELVERQRFLLRAGISAAKVGGTIVYSTCTLAPEENEGVVDWILKREKGRIQIEAVRIPKLEMSKVILTWNGKTYHGEVSKTTRILPSNSMEGFYVAKIRKIKSNIPNAVTI